MHDNYNNTTQRLGQQQQQQEKEEDEEEEEQEEEQEVEPFSVAKPAVSAEKPRRNKSPLSLHTTTSTATQPELSSAQLSADVKRTENSTKKFAQKICMSSSRRKEIERDRASESENA